jgi:hypothetical protein
MAQCVPVGKPRPVLGPRVDNQSLPPTTAAAQRRGSNSNQYPMPRRILPATVEEVSSAEPFSQYGDGSGRIFLDGGQQPQVSRGSGLSSYSQGSLQNTNIQAQSPEFGLIGSFDDTNECGRLHDATPDPFGFDFTFGAAGHRLDEDFLSFDNELPTTHTVIEAPQNDISSIDTESQSLKIDHRNSCLQNLADLHASLLRDLDEVKLSKPAHECDCSRASVERNSENGAAPDHPVGKVLRSSEKYLKILEYFSVPKSSQPSLQQNSCSPETISAHEDLDLALGCDNDNGTPPDFNHSTSFDAGLGSHLSTSSPPSHCDVPTTFSLLTCYISLVRIFRTIFSCIYVSLLPLPPLTWNALPPIFPGLQLAGFAMERQIGMQIRILLQVSEDMLGKIEGKLGVGAGSAGDGGLLGKVMGKGVLRMMLQEEEEERPEGGCGSVESLRGAMASLKGLC